MTYYEVLRRTTTYYDVLRRTTTYYDVLRRTTTYYEVLRRTTTYYDVLRRTTTYYDVVPLIIKWIQAFLKCEAVAHLVAGRSEFGAANRRGQHQGKNHQVCGVAVVRGGPVY